MTGELSRRTLMMVCVGKSGPVTDSAGCQTMQAQPSAAEIRDNTAVVQNFGMTSVPPVGSDVAMIFVVGDRSRGVIVGTNHPASRLRNLSPGQSALYDQSQTKIVLTNDGNIIIALSKSDGKVALAGNVAITGSLTVTGTISADGVISSSQDVLAGPNAISAVGHEHGGVQSGGNNTSPPNHG